MNNQHMGPNGLSYSLPPPPPLVNPPPRIFGNYGQANNDFGLSASLFDDDLLSYGVDAGDQGDPKRRRIARACDQCRRKKIKCDGKQPACTHCTNYKTECVFTQVEKKRQPPKGAKYIEGLENRLGRMESLLRLSGLLNEDDAGATDLGTLEKRLADKAANIGQTNGHTSNGSIASNGPASHHEDEEPASRRASMIAASPVAPLPEVGEGPKEGTPVQDTIASPRSAVDSLAGVQVQEPPKVPEKENEVEALSDMMCSLVTNNCGETRYIGSSSGFSIFSPKGIQWVNEKTGDSSFQEMISSASIEDNKWIHWKPDVFRDIFERKVFRKLPPKQEALSLLKDFFENFNCMFPLFHEPTFMHLVEKHYHGEPYEGSGWWASLNVALAIAHRLRVMSNLVPAEEDEKAWGFLKNALAVQAELTIRNTDLLSVQALLGMALFLMGTPNPQPSFFLVAAAIRLAHSIGLHKRGSGFGLNVSEIEQRKRVFWIAYMLDRDICLRSGRPPIQDDDDMNVELPSADPPDNIGNIPLADGKGKVNLFRLMCTFAIIESKVYRGLYSCKAAKQSDGELLNTIGELDKELEDWKDAIPLDFRPEYEIKAAHTPLVLHVVVLHFSYYNCLTTIHRMSVHHGYWTSRLSNFAIQGLNARPLNPRVFSSAALCVQAARASIHLIKYLPAGDFSVVWLIIYFPVSALVTLFANILQNPQDTRTRADLKLMNAVVSFLSKLCVDEQNSSIRRMLSVCSEFERIAKLVCEKADKEASSRRKRKAQENKAAAAAAQNGSATANGIANGSTNTLQPGTSSQSQPSASPRGHTRTHSQTTVGPTTPGVNGTNGSSHAYTPGSTYSDPVSPTSRPPARARSSGPMSALLGSAAYAPMMFMIGADPNEDKEMKNSESPKIVNSIEGVNVTGGVNGRTIKTSSTSTDTSPQPFPFSPNFTHNSLPGSNGMLSEDFNISNHPTGSSGHNAPNPSFSPSSASAHSHLQPPSSNGNGSGLDFANSFQQPFVPQDLWQMPMTLEWDWADMNGYGAGLGGGPGLAFSDDPGAGGAFGAGGVGMTGVLPGTGGGGNGLNGGGDREMS